jgi:hypothetical protein
VYPVDTSDSVVFVPSKAKDPTDYLVGSFASEEIMVTKKKATKRAVKTEPKATPKEIAWSMPIGVAMDAYLRHATERDHVESMRIYDAIIGSLDPFAGLRHHR